MAAEGHVAVVADGLQDAFGGVCFGNAGFVQVQRQVDAAVHRLDGGDRLFRRRLRQVEDAAAHLLELGALGLDRFAQ